uniref:Proteasome subunit alpha type n=1 Tax=Pseudo-nitzschia australis TaxID=44445 RepID=A0A7S4AFA8_9STRA|mmetsp:Transcript_17999/g.39246  ORF Transcript_17999/g.39246 Transcript_17999/m.39246 type:complete len:268 (-) Transcript_17999:323-1126(-)|eukprot:CAMPEP_0168184832 /NCGR_PEP_ID=MMETSP0139_2-20121125/13475_1 /TAXON_ID=44445 /ORGANISM="Pseudo-nitzschia australis, Strain 10249 10 AB" /LENGTH=267 /DNA_ID=CAMNT_0008106531 /DNA_START=146 /DNA_END=949 /DNA_ORIENTATION=-
MARRYDSSTTTFSPEGRLHQVEYAIEAINNAGTCVGILAKDGIVMASERRITSGLLAPVKTSEKTYQLCSHVSCNVAGLTADANILIDQARLRAGRYAYQYQEHIPVEQLVEHVCNYKQFYTQRGGLRPFGVAFLFAGYDEHYGFQLYQSDPSGNYSGWKATVIGANNQAGKSLLKAEYKTGGEGSAEEGKEEEESIPDVQEALKLAVKVLNKTMDGTTAAAAAEKMELYTMSRGANGECVHHILNKEEASKVIEAVDAETASAGDS